MLKYLITLFLPILLSCSVLPKSALIRDTRDAGTAFKVVYKNKKYIISAGHVCDSNKYMYINNIKLKVIASVNQYYDYCILENNDKVKLKTFKVASTLKINEKISLDAFSKNKKGKLIHNTETGKVIGVIHANMLPVPVLCDPKYKCAAFEFIPNFIVSDVKATFGNSGGPVLNSKQEVVGSISGGMNGKTLITPISAVLDYLEGEYNIDIHILFEMVKVDEIAAEFCGNLKPLVNKKGFYTFSVFCVENDGKTK